MAEIFNNQSRENDSLSSNFSQKIAQETFAEESLEFKYTKVTFYFIILLCATFGNSVVVYVICTSKKMKSSSHLLILNLAVCDLLTPLVSIPFDFALEENGYVWMYGYFMCKILSPAATFSSTASSLTLAAISLDRYRLLMHPFKKKLNSKQIKRIILGVYIFSALAVTPYSYGLRLENGLCQENWSGKKIYRQLYTLALFLFQYAMPLVFMTIMYALAINNLYSTSGKVKNCFIHDGGRKEKDCITRKAVTTAGKRLAKIKVNLKRKLRTADENANIRATKMFMAVVTVFAIFMFPNQVFWIWADFGDGASQAHFPRTAIICWLFTYTNSVVNPVIFAIFSKEFRTGFKGVFGLIFCCNHEALPECHRCEGQTRTDSSTNEIFSEKKTNIYENSTYHSFTNVKDKNPMLTKCPPNHFFSVLNEKADFIDNADFQNTSFQLFSETLVVEKAELSDDTIFKSPMNSTNGVAYSIMNYSGADDVKGNLLLSDEEALECKYSLYEDEFIGLKVDGSLIPALHPKAMAILEDLPETNC